MKKNVIAALVGTLILFAYQALSWMALPFHNDTTRYTPRQAEIMEVLNRNLSENGLYAVPGFDPSLSLTYEQMEAMTKEQMHKPWAFIVYNRSFEGMSAGNLAGGLVINLVSVTLVLLLLNGAKASEKSFAAIFGLVMLVPLLCIFQAVLENVNWFAFPWHFVKGTVLDLLLGWALCGLYLAWRFRRSANA